MEIVVVPLSSIDLMIAGSIKRSGKALNMISISSSKQQSEFQEMATKPSEITLAVQEESQQMDGTVNNAQALI
jgi:hypothetical protein